MKGLQILLEAILRIEHKVDALLRYGAVPVKPMNFTVDPCPSCKQMVNYNVDIEHGLVKRVCGCSTGKQVFVLQPQPIPQQGDSNGRQAPPPPEAEQLSPARRSGSGRNQNRP